MTNQNQNNKTESKAGMKRWPLILAVVFLMLVLTAVGSVFAFQQAYRDRIFPGVKIGYLAVSGQTKAEVLNQLREVENNFQEKGLVFRGEDKEIFVTPITVSEAPDLAKPILLFNFDQTVTQAYQIGRGGSWAQNLLDQLKTMILGRIVKVSYQLDEVELLNHLQTSFSEMETQPLNAMIEIVDGQVEVSQEQSGHTFDYQAAIVGAASQLAYLDFKPIVMELEFREPLIKKSQTTSALDSVDDLLKIDSLKLTAGNRWWKVTKEEFIPWLEFQLVDDEVMVGLNKEKVLAFLQPIAELINVQAQDAKFSLNGDRVNEFQASRDGVKLDLEASYEKINQQLMGGDAAEIELVTEVDPAKVSTADVNDLGIKELIGRGTSNFAGSPKNRRHNIATGAGSLNGILIEPDEEFSLLDALGEIDGEHGYLQELVIKGDRTIPEYGGGLCQIGTTAFRAALRSGLPITQRRNHSYRVVYYEPAGMDATIYDPFPDLKFLNDTGHHILFVARIEGDDLIFDFYGTSDGRKVTIAPDPPSIYDVTRPGEPRYIETEELAPGEKRKVESAHNGADTYFKYTVEYLNGEVKDTDFYSHYVAWPEVWLVGKEPMPESTTTPEVITES
ncbi:MAG: VanW family protein [Patescibacteria group bacterium]|jgi:vancomycin resistance protein YoaR|nr:VanW family protein [Patescibacteria group bacterium]